MKKFLLSFGMMFAAISLNPLYALAGTHSFCNRSPSPVTFAIGWDIDSQNYRTKGWWTLQPGECSSKTVPTRNIYLFAESYDDLARWLNNGNDKKWNSMFHRRCVNYPDAFDYEFTRQIARSCPHPVYMKKLRTGTATRPGKFHFVDKNHKKLPLNMTKIVRRDLTGVMNWEAQLLRTAGREPPFSIGVTLSTNCSSSSCVTATEASSMQPAFQAVSYGQTAIQNISNIEARVLGAKIEYVADGMPAAEEALETGDIIVGLDGYRVETAAHVQAILADIPFDRNTPVPISIFREGAVLHGTILPKFFYFNHPIYDPADAAGAAIWEFADSVPLLFGNEVACGLKHGVGEGISSWAQDRDYDSAYAGKQYSRCADSLNRRQALYRVLYKDATTAGSFASLFVGGGILVKGGKLTKGVTLASRSRKVSRPNLATRSFKR